MSEVSFPISLTLGDKVVALGTVSVNVTVEANLKPSAPKAAPNLPGENRIAALMGIPPNQR